MDAAFIRSSGELQVDSIITDSICQVRQNLYTNTIVYPLQLQVRDSVDLAIGDGLGILFQIPANGTYATGAAIEAIRVNATDAQSNTMLVLRVSDNDATLDTGIVVCTDSTVFKNNMEIESEIRGSKQLLVFTDSTTVQHQNSTEYLYSGFVKGAINEGIRMPAAGSIIMLTASYEVTAVVDGVGSLVLVARASGGNTLNFTLSDYGTTGQKGETSTIQARDTDTFATGENIECHLVASGLDVSIKDFIATVFIYLDD